MDSFPQVLSGLFSDRSKVSRDVLLTSDDSNWEK